MQRLISNILYRYNDRFLSRWITLAFDIAIVYASYIITVLIRYNFVPSSVQAPRFDLISLIITFVYALGFLFGKTYHGILRHTGLGDLGRIAVVNLFAFLVLLTAAVFSLRIGIAPERVASVGILLVHFFMTTLLMLMSRLAIRAVYHRFNKEQGRQRINYLIFGAGQAGMLVLNALRQDKMLYNYVVAFIDDNESKINKTLDGIPVISCQKGMSYEFVKRNLVSQLIIAIRDLEQSRKQEIVEKALSLKLKVKTVPPVHKWIDGQLTAKQLRQVKIEELLGRDPIILENNNISAFVKNEIILVTGAAGSIGSEIARQVLQYKPARLILLDQAESPLYDLQFELKNNKKYADLFNRVVFLVASVKDKYRMQQVFDKYKPNVVFHAAAYKHVPMMEEHPYEAVMINVFGTKILAELSLEYGVKKFVMISTDKAVNPTNVMGATKRIAEMLVQSLSNGTTQFITTRFGNVLGSNGSVIPLFRKQIEQGGPVTVTHKDIIRYFMTIPEACNLVLEAGAMGNGGEIFVFDMGKPVRIYDLAERMIRLSGLEPGKDIQIVESGLRPGEKLYEELLSDEENTIDTHHPKIRKARVRDCDEGFIRVKLLELGNALIEGSDFALVAKMKELVPEFKSNNSIFARLDIKS
ncbi:MAG: polysaccharide biosynthesis protein [Bacteroidales bacterium]